ncbi:hypothetical protein THAOC_11507, partial [Thalassiosira oceanica]
VDEGGREETEGLARQVFTGSAPCRTTTSARPLPKGPLPVGVIETRLKPRKSETARTMTVTKTLNVDALAQTMSIDDMAEDELNRGTLRLLRDDDASLPHLRLWGTGEDAQEHGDYHPGSSEELSWLGHFAKRSTHLKTIHFLWAGIFEKCSEQSIDRFFEDLGRCHHVKTMRFDDADLTEFVDKLGPVVKNNDITNFFSDGSYLGVSEANALFNTFSDMKSLEDLWISYDNYDFGDDSDNDLDDDIMARCIPSLAGCTCMQRLILKDMRMSSKSCAALSAIFPHMAGLQELDLAGNLFDGNCVQSLARGLVECRSLRTLRLSRNRIGDDGLAMLIQGLPTSIVSLDLSYNEIETGWNAFLLFLCDPTSINATHGSNHILRYVGYTANISRDVITMLRLNCGKDKSHVAAMKILQTHRHLDMRPLFDRELDLLPCVVAWLERFADSRPVLKLSSIFDFVRAMPMVVVDGIAGEKKGKGLRRNNGL